MAGATEELTIDEIARTGRATVFLSSHILSEVDRMCQRIGLIRNGTLVAVRTLSELRAAAPRRRRRAMRGARFSGRPTGTGATRR